ncbi:MAG TPA: peptidylprolyl isomerase [Edaphobacter sp.]|nr:peptidylprolyl isomerase [Edaphobacter sp.]
MTLKISQFAVLCGLGWLAVPGVTSAQAPRYQSPLSVPNAPQQQITLPVTPPVTPNGTVVEDIVAHVNDLIISRSDVERAEQTLVEENQQSNATPAEAAERRKNLLRDMIDKQLLLSRGKELGVNADAEVIRQLDEIRKSNHLDTMEDLEKAARQQGVSFEDFKASIRDRVITQMVVRDEVGRRLGSQMTQAQEQAYYDAHKQDFMQPEQIKLSEILIPTPADANEAVIAQAQSKADGIESKLKAGGDFAELAKQDSGGPTAAQGGELGMYKRGSLGQVLEDQTFNLQTGQWTAPIRTKQGFVILKVTEHQVAGVAPLKDVEPQVQEAMYSEAMQPALRTYLMKLREDAYIEIRPGYVDSGASPRETKPVYTASTPPPVKKKTVQQKKRFDRGTKYSTVAKSGKTPAAIPVVAVTTTPTSTKTKTAMAAKPKKIKREKIRFGQAPRNALPAGPEERASGADVGAGAASAAGAAGNTTGAPGAENAAVAPLENASSASDTGPNPLDAKGAPEGKTRYSARAKEVSAEKKAAKGKKLKEKAAAGPIAATSEESASEKMQAAPLGLSGDTSKKKKKQAKDKNAPKERLQNQAPKPAAPAPAETPSKAPDRGTPQEGILPPQKATDKTTVPPNTPPATPSTPPPTTPPTTPQI